MGCDARESGIADSSDVSIHAPTWGATEWIKGAISEDEFQSTHPHGVRQSFCQPISLAKAFQSTHPHGVRQREVV